MVAWVSHLVSPEHSELLLVHLRRAPRVRSLCVARFQLFEHNLNMNPDHPYNQYISSITRAGYVANVIALTASDAAAKASAAAIAAVSEEHPQEVCDQIARAATRANVSAEEAAAAARKTSTSIEADAASEDLSFVAIISTWSEAAVNSAIRAEIAALDAERTLEAARVART